MKGDHRLVATEENVEDGRCRSTCACSWRTGWRRNRAAALRAIGDHTDEKQTPLTAARAQAILNDHAEGLHNEFDGPDGCRWWDCSEAYWLVAGLAEKRGWEDWREADARHRHAEHL